MLDRSTTDTAGRFKLQWERNPREEDITIELLNEGGGVEESEQITAADLFSPPVLEFSGRALVGSPRTGEDRGGACRFEADGDYPLCVTSSCQEVTLSWDSPEGSEVSIVSEWESVRSGLPERGSVKVLERGDKTYTLRTRPPGERSGRLSELAVEVRRYPALSLVLDGLRFGTGSEVEFGVCTSCPAGEDGVLVSIMTSDSAMVPQSEVIIPAGANWATTRVTVGRRAGAVKVTAMAPGYVRDGVDFLLE